MDKVKIIGDGNIVEFGENIDNSGSSIRIQGQNNRLIIESEVLIRHSNISLKGDNIKFEIKKSAELTGCIVSMFTNTSFLVDEKTTMGNGEVTIAEEKSITIGKDCMFAHGHEIRTSDMHPIYSIEDGGRLNGGLDVVIGDHVWLGKNVTILKGAKIANNSVVAINSVVNNEHLEQNVIIAGMPAKVIKRDVLWGRKMYHKTMYDDPTLGEFIENYNSNAGKVKAGR